MPPEFAPGESFDKLLERAHEDVRAVISQCARCGEFSERLLTVFPPAVLKAMRQDPDVTAQYLGNSRADFRLGALFLIYEYWLGLPAFAGPCLELAFSDSESVVRGLALHCLPALYDSLRDPCGALKTLLYSVLRGSQRLGAMDETKKETFDSLENVLRDKVRRELSVAAGPAADEVLSGPLAAESHLTHSDLNLQWVALVALTHLWKPTQAVANFCERLIVERSLPLNLEVAAIGLLTAFYRRSNNPRVGMILANVVRDPGKHEAARENAYLALYSIRGIPASKWPDRANGFPSYVDWGFLATFTGRKGEGGSHQIQGI